MALASVGLRRWAVLLGLCLVGLLRAYGAEQACGIAPVVAADAQANIFTEQQEEWLGEAMAASVEAEYRTVRDPAQSAYLQAIVDRLAATLPQTHIHFHVQLIDSAEVNGFSVAGGRIYLTRKLAASAQSDDELASVLGHEMGHIASHQFAFETTRDMKRLLGVTSVGDRADIFAKFQRLTEARLKAKTTSVSDDDAKQDEADRIGVYVTAAAGYHPQASAEFWDRMFFTQGHKGGTLSNLFGISRPSERRLGRITKEVAALPAGCGGMQPVRAAGFAEWHERVVENRAVTVAEANGVHEQPLTPALRMELDRLRFSPDGQYLLAQDEGSIFVLSRADLSVLLKTDANRALPAQFSPDSRHLVFTTQGLHTEEWDIATKKLVAAHEPLAKSHCIQAKISPDGRTVVCMSFNGESGSMDLSLLDAASGAVVWRKDGFFQPNLFYLYVLLFRHEDETAGDMVPSSFSADGNFLLIGPDDRKIGIDLRTRTPVKVGGDLRSKVDGPYAFVGNDRVAGVDSHSIKDSGVFSFPEGKLVQRSQLQSSFMQSVSAVDGPEYVVVDGIQDYMVSVADLDKGHIVVGARTPAIDIWGGTIAFEDGDGAVVLCKLGDPKPTDANLRVHLPLSDLGSLRAAALSPDGRLLAMSTRSRGAVWNRETGQEELRLPGFEQVSWGADGKLYLQFPKQPKQDRKVFAINVATHVGRPATYSVEKMGMEYGLLREWKDLGKSGKEIVVRSLSDGKDLWSRQFAEGMPGYTASAGGRDLLFSTPLTWASAKSALRDDAKLAREAAALKQKNNGRLIEALDAKTGAVLGRVVIDLPGDYAGADGLNRVEDLLYVTSSDNRTLVFSMADGRELRQVYGTLTAVDQATRRVCFHDRDAVAVYDADGKELTHLETGKSLRYTAFANRGSQLILLGADQVVRTAEIGDGATGVTAVSRSQTSQEQNSPAQTSQTQAGESHAP